MQQLLPGILHILRHVADNPYPGSIAVTKSAGTKLEVTVNGKVFHAQEAMPDFEIEFLLGVIASIPLTRDERGVKEGDYYKYSQFELLRNRYAMTWPKLKILQSMGLLSQVSGGGFRLEQLMALTLLKYRDEKHGNTKY